MMKKGFTLVEIIIYVALATVILLGLVYLLMGVSEARAKARAITEVQATERQVFSQLRLLVEEAVEINWSASNLDNDLGKLVLVDALGQTKTLEINNTGQLLLNMGTESDLLADNTLSINKLKFSRLDDKTVGIDLAVSYRPLLASNRLNYSASWHSAMRLAN